jgi:hypothetical protein
MCAETGKKINKGEIIFYDSQIKKGFCNDSKRYQNEREGLSTDQYIQAQENAYYERLNSYL